MVPVIVITAADVAQAVDVDITIAETIAAATK